MVNATDRSKISSDQKPLFIALSLNTLSFFANTHFKIQIRKTKIGLKNELKMVSGVWKHLIKFNSILNSEKE